MTKRNPMASIFAALSALERSGLSKPAKPAKSKRAAKAKRSSSSPAKLRTVLLGQPLKLTYRHAGGGAFEHKFNGTARISYTPDGRYLVIDRADVRAFIT